MFATGEVGNRDLASGYTDLDRGRDFRLFGLVERIVDQFLNDDGRPVFAWWPVSLISSL